MNEQLSEISKYLKPLIPPDSTEDNFHMVNKIRSASKDELRELCLRLFENNNVLRNQINQLFDIARNQIIESWDTYHG